MTKSVIPSTPTPHRNLVYRIRQSLPWRTASFARSHWTAYRGVMTTELNDSQFRVAVASRRELKRLRNIGGERSIIKRICSKLRPHDTFADIGANVGLFSLAVAAQLSERGQVIAFEPEPRNFSHLVRNFELNGLSHRLQAEQSVLTDRAGTAQLRISGEVGDGTHSLLSGTIDSERSVHAERLDDFSARHQVYPDVIKIDVEGAELLVLRGMQQLLIKHPPRLLMIEVHGQHLRDAGERPEEVAELLTSNGYCCERSSERHGEEHLWFSKKSGC